MKAIRIKVNGLSNPIGIDEEKIAFSWNIEGGKRQTAYMICAAESVDALINGNYSWCSGKVETDSMFGHLYTEETVSRQRLYFRVDLWDENDVKGPWSEVAFWEMGLKNESDWIAKFITGDYEPEKFVKYPADYFRKTFTVEKKAVKARLYSTACGVYVNGLNGNTVGEDILAPGRSTCEQRLFYQTYDVTELICEGENQWNVILGDGWFRGKCGAFGASYVFGDRTAYLGQLEIYFEDGTMMTVASDESFDWSNDGPVRMNDMKDFGIVDLNLTPSYSKKAAVTDYATKLCCSNNVPVREKEHFYPSVLNTPDGSCVLDFGQNIAGYISFHVSGNTGDTVRLLFGEMIDAGGNFTNHNLITLEKNDYIPDYCDDSHFQELELTLTGNRDYFKPQLTVQGFRYVKLINWPEQVEPSNFEAIAVYSDTDYLVSFHSSDYEIEKLVKNTEWSIKGNYLDVPTDCPTRERAAWLGDAQLFFDTSNYFVDGEAFYKKWIRDIYDDQAESGLVYNIVPRVAPHEGMNLMVEGSSGWADAGILIPYRYYKLYRDKEFLTEMFPKMQKLMDYMLSRMGDESNPDLDKMLPPGKLRKYVVTSGFHFGEWNEPNTTMEMVMAPKFEVATAYLAYSLTCMGELAAEIDRADESARYSKLAAHVKEAYAFYFLNKDIKTPERMCEFVRPLALNLTNDDTEEIAKSLDKLVREQNYHVGTGFLSTPFLLPVVGSKCGNETAWKMLENREYPSWLAEVKQGATTVWENWDGVASRNHYSNGAVCEWIFGTACGIKILDENTFKIAPKLGGMTKKMGLEYLSRYGLVSCTWEINDNTVDYRIYVPSGTGALVELDGMETFKADAGEYRFSVERKQS